MADADNLPDEEFDDLPVHTLDANTHDSSRLSNTEGGGNVKTVGGDGSSVGDNNIATDKGDDGDGNLQTDSVVGNAQSDTGDRNDAGDGNGDGIQDPDFATGQFHSSSVPAPVDCDLKEALDLVDFIHDGFVDADETAV